MYVTINKDLEKTATKVVLDKDQNLLWSGWMTSELSKQRNVAINVFYLQQNISALETVLSKSFTGAFSSNSSLDVREV